MLRALWRWLTGASDSRKSSSIEVVKTAASKPRSALEPPPRPKTTTAQASRVPSSPKAKGLLSVGTKAAPRAVQRQA
ncbi:MAG: hypothetical protein HYV07_15420 [Deltaproteobacteria bacterium]|nr:hypothetical protein [Deltaproteobacteria bacterium]